MAKWILNNLHQLAVHRFLWFYERYMLPRNFNRHRPSLLQIKR